MTAEAPRESDGHRRFVTTVVEVEGREETKVVELPVSEPEPWGEDARLTVVGRPIPRVDAAEKVTGRARYTADIVRPRMLHAAIVRATIPAGTISEIDVTGAMAAPGVVDAITLEDIPRIRIDGNTLFDRTVKYVGQPVAAVCAETWQAALAAAEIVRVTIERAAHVATFADAIAADAPLVRRSGNVSRSSPSIMERGNVERGLSEADVIVRGAYRTPPALHTAMEPHGAVAEWEGVGDRLTLWESTQGVFRVRDEVATGLGLSRSRVRVIKEHMGGGFGAKNSAGAHTFIAAILARRTGRAVRCVVDRYGEQVDTGHRPESRIHLTLGARRDGTLTAIVADSQVTMGVGGWEASPTAIMHELYGCENVKTTDVYAWVHSQAMDSFRAPGHVEGAFALERGMDTLARALSIDPLRLRLSNVPGRDQEKGRPYSSDRLRECLVEGARRFGWPGWEAPAGLQDSEMRAGDAVGDGMVREVVAGGGIVEAGGGRRLRGIGMAAQVWGAGGGPPAYATIKLNSDGTADVLSGTQDLGTGTRTVLAQIAAESLGSRFEDVRVVLGDTERTPYAGNSWGSMTIASVGPAVRMAGEEVRRRLCEAAAEMLECRPGDLSARGSVISTRDGTRHLTFADVTGKLGNVMIMGHGSRGPNRRDVGLVTAGAQFAEVEVDAETGQVRVIRIVAVHDAGRIINPLLAQSQLEGGIIQGLGLALFEERIIDRATGVPLNPGMHDYKVPTSKDVPMIDATCLPVTDPQANHIGARGLAEPPIIPTAPAIANAVANATGAAVDELPLTPRRVLHAIRSTYA
ncbi:MAG: putative xanthine dehydrogenase molybdenum-binding subunit XdhA [Gemmatimonadaceae bacterium]|nr:putative xanthine dehydrogenase molybdenum-binding subunit XdhA [Gemmatimonadaceae bacterium]